MCRFRIVSLVQSPMAQASTQYKAHRGQAQPKKSKRKTKEEKNQAKLDKHTRELNRLKFSGTNQYSCVKGFRCCIFMRYEHAMLVELERHEFFVGKARTVRRALSIIHSQFIGELGYQHMYGELTNNERNYEPVPILDDEIIRENNNNNSDNNYKNEIESVLDHFNREYEFDAPFWPTLEIKEEPIYTSNQ